MDGSTLLICFIVAGWIGGIIDGILTAWAQSIFKRGFIYAVAYFIGIGAILFWLGITIWYMLLGGLVGTLFAVLAYLQASYWIMIAVGVLLGIFTAYHMLKSHGIPN